MKTVIISVAGDRIPEFYNCARQLCSNEVVAVVFGSDEEAQNAVSFANKVIWVEPAANVPLETYLPVVSKAVREEDADLVIVGSDAFGRCAAALVAAAYETSAVSPTNAVHIVDGSICANQTVFGGGAIRTVKARGTLVISAAAGISDDAIGVESGEIFVLDTQCDASARIVERRVKQASNSDVVSAQTVVCIGRGFTNSEDLQFANDLATAVNGTVGFTRPVTEAEPPVAAGEPYIGVSGLQVKPNLYFAVAVSGQTQHAVGFNGAKTVAAINKDPNALIFRKSDYGIVADYKEAIPLLVKTLENTK